MRILVFLLALAPGLALAQSISPPSPPQNPIYIQAVCGSDNTALIQASINAAASRLLILPPCPQTNPIIATSLTIPDNTSLQGMGRGVTWLKQADGANTPFIQGSNFAGGSNLTLNSNIELGDLAIDGNGANQSSNALNRCVYFLGVADLKVHDLEVLNCRSDAVSISGNGASTSAPTFAHAIFVNGTIGTATNGNAIGFALSARARDGAVSDILTENTAGIGVLIDASEGNWTNITAKAAGTGFACTNSGTTTVDSPGGGGASQTSWNPCPSGIFIRNVTNINACNLTATGNQYYGIVVVGLRHATLCNFVATQNSLATNNTWDDLHFDYNVFVSTGYGETSNVSLSGAQLGANGQTPQNGALNMSTPTTRYGLFIGDGLAGSLADLKSIATAGTGNTFGAVLTFTGGTCAIFPKVTVAAAPGGGVTSLAHNYTAGAGLCTVLPSNPITLTGGAGTPPTLNVTWSSAYMTGINIGTTLTAATRTPSFITGWNVQTSAGNFGP